MNLILILILTWFQGNEWDKANREVVRLAPSSFKQLPRELIQELERRHCTVPPVWGSRQPGNVIRGEFLKKGQSDCVRVGRTKSRSVRATLQLLRRGPYGLALVNNKEDRVRTPAAAPTGSDARATRFLE